MGRQVLPHQLSRHRNLQLFFVCSVGHTLQNQAMSRSVRCLYFFVARLFNRISGTRSSSAVLVVYDLLYAPTPCGRVLARVPRMLNYFDLLPIRTRHDIRSYRFDYNKCLTKASHHTGHYSLTALVTHVTAERIRVRPISLYGNKLSSPSLHLPYYALAYRGFGVRTSVSPYH